MNEWETLYASGKHHTFWPWTDVVSLVHRHVPKLYNRNVLELGCGTGANRRFFDSVGAIYYGIESSPTAIKTQSASRRLFCGDFTKGFPFETQFDLIFDRAAVTHNELDAVNQTAFFIYDALPFGGIFIGVDWFSTKHADRYQFDEVGTTTFFDEPILLEVFRKFKLVYLEEKVIERLVPPRGQFASWNLVVQK